MIKLSANCDIKWTVFTTKIAFSLLLTKSSTDFVEWLWKKLRRLFETNWKVRKIHIKIRRNSAAWNFLPSPDLYIGFEGEKHVRKKSLMYVGPFEFGYSEGRSRWAWTKHRPCRGISLFGSLWLCKANDSLISWFLAEIVQRIMRLKHRHRRGVIFFCWVAFQRGAECCRKQKIEIWLIHENKWNRIQLIIRFLLHWDSVSNIKVSKVTKMIRIHLGGRRGTPWSFLGWRIFSERYG